MEQIELENAFSFVLLIFFGIYFQEHSNDRNPLSRLPILGHFGNTTSLNINRNEENTVFLAATRKGTMHPYVLINELKYMYQNTELKIDLMVS